MNANLACILHQAATIHADRTALKLDEAELSYETLDALSAGLARRLEERGVDPGDRVAIMLPNVPHFAIVYYAVLRAGAVAVPVNVLLKRREVAFQLVDSEARVIFGWRDFAEAAAAGAADAGVDCVLPGELRRLLSGPGGDLDVVARDGSDTAVILYTSGMTGRPKGAELTHASLARNAEIARELFALDEHSVTLGALPLFHSFGQTCALNATIGVGGMLTLVPRFDARKVLEVMQRDRVTVFEGVPTMYSALLNHPERDRFESSSLRRCVSGGASLPVELLRAFERAFGCTILEGYSLSETSPIASFNDPDAERKPGSIGTPVEGVEMKVVDEEGAERARGEVGEIAIRGHDVMKGYWRRPEETAAALSDDGWFRTGDLARVDEDGYFFIVDRKKDLVIRGGFNVYPREIEEVLYEHPAMREAASWGSRTRSSARRSRRSSP